jgi:hypothetical protein
MMIGAGALVVAASLSTKACREAAVETLSNVVGGRVGQGARTSQKVEDGCLSMAGWATSRAVCPCRWPVSCRITSRTFFDSECVLWPGAS